VAVRTLWVALVTATLLAGCGGPGGEIGLRETGAGRTTMVSADPVPLAECMKDALERKEWGYIRATFPPTLSLLPHRNQAKLTADGNGGMQYLIDIQDKGYQSQVEVYGGRMGFMYSGEEVADVLVEMLDDCP
jgi:hypothetical protein